MNSLLRMTLIRLKKSEGANEDNEEKEDVVKDIKEVNDVDNEAD